MEEKLLEDLQLQQDVARRDANSPLFLIREKEMEISGRVLAARQEAEQLLADARRKAAEIIGGAESSADTESQEHQRQLMAQAEADVAALRDGFDDEVAPLREGIRQRHPQAVDAVVKMVTRV